MQRRGNNFTTQEIQFLFDIIEKHKTIIESRRTDRHISSEQTEAWFQTEQEFNAKFKHTFRNAKQLRNKYETIMRKRALAKAREEEEARAAYALRPSPTRQRIVDSKFRPMSKTDLLDLEAIRSEIDATLNRANEEATDDTLIDESAAANVSNYNLNAATNCASNATTIYNPYAEPYYPNVATHYNPNAAPYVPKARASQMNYNTAEANKFNVDKKLKLNQTVQPEAPPAEKQKEKAKEKKKEIEKEKEKEKEEKKRYSHSPHSKTIWTPVIKLKTEKVKLEIEHQKEIHDVEMQHKYERHEMEMNKLKNEIIWHQERHEVTMDRLRAEVGAHIESTIFRN